MKKIISDLKRIVEKLEKYNSYDTSIFDLILENINQVSQAWSGSILGYQANVYYINFASPPRGARFSQEWGIDHPVLQFDSSNILGGSTGEWVEYTSEEVINYINEQAGNPDLSTITEDSLDSKKVFEACKEDILLTINAANILNGDSFLKKIVKDIEVIIIPTRDDFLKNNFSNKMSLSTRDSRVDNKISFPPHLGLQSTIYELTTCFTVIKLLEDKTNKMIKYLSKKQESNQMNKPNTLSNQIFIVHGHDDNLKTEVARFIENLGFEAVILHEKASNGKTIIEKIEHYSNVSFGIVLYTACDIGGKSKDELEPRARQNVVFEHGYLIGKIGRENVVAVVKDKVEKPNDISGIVYINTSNHWKNDLVKEMIEVGYNIDLKKVL